MPSLLTRGYWSAFTAWQARDEGRLPYRPLGEILSLQSRRLQATITHAYATVPHYREAMARAGLRPEDLRKADDLSHLALVAGDQLAAAPERFKSSRYSEARTLALRSSGTGGKAKTVWYSAAALFTALAHGQRQRAVFARFIGRRFGYREMTALRPNAVADQMRRFFESHAWVPRSLDLERAALPLDAGFEESVARINAFQPAVVFGYGSHLGALFRWAFERGREIHRPHLIWYGADRMADADRELLEHELRIPVLSSYQADEALRLAFQCELRQGFHLNLDDVAVRVVDGQGRTVGPGETGEIVISNLTNRATVLLNYKLGDLVTVSAGPCPCGRTLPTIERIDGRADDCLLLPNGEVRHPLAVLRGLQTVPGVVRVQLVQDEVARFSLRVVCALEAEWPATRTRLERVLRSCLGQGIAVETERVEALTREPGGKLRAVISRCRKPS